MSWKFGFEDYPTIVCLLLCFWIYQREISEKFFSKKKSCKIFQDLIN